MSHLIHFTSSQVLATSCSTLGLLQPLAGRSPWFFFSPKSCRDKLRNMRIHHGVGIWGYPVVPFLLMDVSWYCHESQWVNKFWSSLAHVSEADRASDSGAMIYFRSWSLVSQMKKWCVKSPAHRKNRRGVLVAALFLLWFNHSTSTQGGAALFC